MDRLYKVRRKYRRKIAVLGAKEYQGLQTDSRLDIIEQLIPLGLMKVQEELQAEVRQWAGQRYSRGRYVRYGRNPGSVVLGGQRLAVDVPRIRDLRNRREISLQSYQRLHRGGVMEDQALYRVLKGISCRDYKGAAYSIPQAFGLSSSSVSRHFIRASQQKLQELQERDLSGHDFVVILLDGKSFAEANLIVACGVTLKGRKIFLGFIEAFTENEKVAKDFLCDLIRRGFSFEEGILVVVDGSKGFLSAIEKVFESKAIIQRCQWHKRENVIAYLPKVEQPFLRRRLQEAYEKPTYSGAKAALLSIRRDLEKKNLSAVRSLDEGFEETLTLHRLGLFAQLGRSLKTVNCMESINAAIERRCGKVSYWKNSSQRQRWLAATLLDMEPNLNRVQGHHYLEQLRGAIKRELKLDEKNLKEAA